MKRTGFLTKVYKEGKLNLVDPSEEIKKSYLEKSESNLAASKILVRAEKCEESSALAYYSMYHALTALLFKTGIKCENHTAAIILLGLLFGQDNKQISFAKKERLDKQYYVDFQIELNDAKELIKMAEEFNSQMTTFIETLTEKDIQNSRTELMRLIGDEK